MKGLFYSFRRALRRQPAVADRATVAGSGVTMREDRAFGQRKIVLNLEDVHVPLVDEAGVVAFGSLKILDLPAGLVGIKGAVMDLALTKSHATGVSDTWDGDIALGTTAAGNNNALATTEQNIIPTTATPQAVAGATTGDGKSTSTEDAVIDGTGTASDVYLNILVDDADHDVTTNPTDIIVNGTITITYAMYGDL